MKLFFKVLWRVLLVTAFIVIALPYISPRFKGILNNFVHPILPEVSQIMYSESKTARENLILKKRLAYYQSQKRLADSLFDENKKLRELLEIQEIPFFDTIVASVSARSPLTAERRFIIDKGEIHGLSQGMPVLTDNSIIGRVYQVNRDHSLVLTLASLSIFCRVKGTNAYGKLNGEAKTSKSGKLLCELNWLPRDEELRPGMTVLTSGFGSEEEISQSGAGLIPKNLKVGIIHKLFKNEKFQKAIVELSADWQSFEHVIILKKKLNQ